MDEERYRRALHRERARERLAALAPGGAPDWPIAVRSAAVIEPRAAALSCPQCGGRYRVLEHTRPVPERRRLEVRCRQCSAPRTLWFRIAEPEAS